MAASPTLKKSLFSILSSSLLTLCATVAIIFIPSAIGSDDTTVAESIKESTEGIKIETTKLSIEAANPVATPSIDATKPSLKAASPAVVSSIKITEPIVFNADYKASIKGFAVSANRTLKHLDNGQFELLFTATSWAANLEESSIFEWNKGQIKPLSYRFHQSAFGKKRQRTLSFNTDQNTISSDNDGDIRVIEQTTHTLDTLNYQLQLQQDLIANKRDLQYIVANKGNLKKYRFEPQGEEVIETNFGSLNTVKVKVIREGKNKTTYIWFAKNWGYLLARLEQYNGDKQTLSINLDTATVDGITVTGG